MISKTEITHSYLSYLIVMPYSVKVDSLEALETVLPFIKSASR